MYSIFCYFFVLFVIIYACSNVLFRRVLCIFGRLFLTKKNHFIGCRFVMFICGVGMLIIYQNVIH